MPVTAEKKPCSTCARPWAQGEFYATGGECKGCKRSRSRQNRAVQARKIAAFERLIDSLAVLSAKADHSPRDHNQSKAMA
jgi:hypothetical protein